MRSSRATGRFRTGVLLVLFFLSGAAALIYQVLWLKELGLLLGVTAYAAATTLAVFFLGLSAGSLVWGRRSSRIQNPLRVYALLEFGVAGSALAYFVLLDLYRLIFPSVVQYVGHRPAAMVMVKLALAVGVLFLPAFFMGGTLPVMGQYLVRRSTDFGRRASALYAINTFGAASGALAAGFVLPRLLGFTLSYWLAIGLNLLVFVVAFAWSRAESPVASPKPTDAVSARPTDPSGARVSPSVVAILAVASGFLTLALEVLWTRMFSQVLHNSVYTFAAILAVFLIALAFGSMLANLLCRVGVRQDWALYSLLLASAVGVLATPVVFSFLTSGLQQFGLELGWVDYSLAVFGLTLAVLLVPGMLVGSVFPYLMKVSESWVESAGRTIGHLAAINTGAAIVGSMAAGFLLLQWLGLWRSIALIAVAYFLLGVLLLTRAFDGRRRNPVAILVGAMALLGWTGARVFDIPIVHLAEDESLEWLREGPQGTVAVVRRGADLRLKVNNHYLLGTVASTPNQRIQAWLPLSLHQDPRSVFFLGMGTGITAGGALDFPVESVVVTELNRDVIAASKEVYEAAVNGLFSDPRVSVLAEDGRTYLGATTERFDLIIGDIFLTYRVGVGSLYTLEHFDTVRDRLADDGLFVQWLPMFDLSEEEFGTIARTMLAAFPHVTLWRRSVSPEFPVYAMVASMEAQRLSPETLRASFGELVARGKAPAKMWLSGIPLAAFAGNLSAARQHFEQFPLSTDDQRPLEYSSPITERDAKGAHQTSTLAHLKLVSLAEDLLRLTEPGADESLGHLRERDLREIEAGLEYYRYEALKRAGRVAEAEAALERYRALLEGPLDPSFTSETGGAG